MRTTKAHTLIIFLTALFLGLWPVSSLAFQQYNCVARTESFFAAPRDDTVQTFQCPADCLAYCTVDNVTRATGNTPNFATCIQGGSGGIDPTCSSEPPNQGTPSSAGPGTNIGPGSSPGTNIGPGSSPGTNPSSPSAGGGSFSLPNPLAGGNVNTFGEVMQKIAQVAMQIGLPLVVIFMIYAGFLFVSARGNEEKLTSAKNTFFWAVIGALLVVGAYAIATAIQNFAQRLQ